MSRRQLLLSHSKYGLLSLLLLIPAGCQKADSGPPQARPRPVSVLKLQVEQPESATRYTGSVSAWKVEDIGFEVSGRIVSILETGTDIKGVEEQEGKTTPGAVIATLDRGRYEIQLAAAQANVKTATARRDAAKNDLEKILPQQIVAAKVDLKLGTAEYQRQQDLFDQNAGTQTELDQAIAARDSAQATLDQLEESKTVKEAEIASYEAQIQEALEAVDRATRDLNDTTLHAPFSGRIAQSYKTLGSVVQPGEPVIQLQMTNPILVNVEVDSETDARLNYGDIVQVYPPDNPSQPMKAMVYETASIADPSTRTFLVQLLVMNDKVVTGLPEEPDYKKDLRTRQLGSTFQEQEDPTKPHYIGKNALHRDEKGDFVFRVKDFTWQERVGTTRTKFEVEKVYVSLGEGQITIFDVATFRELSELGDIKPQEDMFVGTIRTINGDKLSPEEGSKRLEEEGVIHWVRERWSLRPGDFLDVELGEKPLPEGFYVPMDAVVKRIGSNKSSVFVVNNPEGDAKVKEVFVQATPSIASDKLVLIVPNQAGELSDGDLIASYGAHYLEDGEAVRVTNLLEVTE